MCTRIWVCVSVCMFVCVSECLFIGIDEQNKQEYEKNWHGSHFHSHLYRHSKKEHTYSTHIEDIFTAQRCQMIKRKSYSPPGCWHIYNCILKFRYDCTFRGCYGRKLPYHQRLSSLIVRRRASHAICMGVPVVANTGLGYFFMASGSQWIFLAIYIFS